MDVVCSQRTAGKSAAAGGLVSRKVDHVDRRANLILRRFAVVSTVIVGVVFSCTAVAVAKKETGSPVDTPVPKSNQVFGVYPSVIQRTVGRGESVVEKVKVKNDTESTISFFVTTENVAPASGNAGGTRFIGDKKNPLGARDWLQPNIEKFELKPGSSKSVQLTIAVPDHANSGGHYAAMFINNEPTTGNVAITTRVAVLVLLTVKGSIKHNLDVALTPGINVQATDDASWKVRIQNKGNVHESVGGTLRVSQLFGGSRKIRVSPIVSLPGTTRYITVNARLRNSPNLLRANFAPVNWQSGENRRLKVPAAKATLLLFPWWAVLCLAIAFVAIGHRWKQRRSERTNAATDEIDDFPHSDDDLDATS